jgi:hypothetical protein
METNELYKMLCCMFDRKKVNFNVIPCDYLQYVKLDKRPLALVVNDCTSDESGNHWVGIYVPNNRGPLYFFCSYGLGINSYASYFNEFTRKLKMDIIENIKCLQALKSNVCGLYVIYFLYKINMGCCLKSVYHNFSNNVKKNDANVIKFSSKFFMPTINKHKNVNNVINQCCTPFELL